MNQYEKDKQPKVMLAFHKREDMKINKPVKRWSTPLVIRKMQRNPNISLRLENLYNLTIPSAESMWSNENFMWSWGEFNLAQLL